MSILNLWGPNFLFKPILALCEWLHIGLGIFLTIFSLQFQMPKSAGPPPPPPLNTPAANNGAFMKNRHGKKTDQHDRSHFYPVTKEPTTPSQDAPRKRKTRHSQNPPQVKVPMCSLRILSTYCGWKEICGFL